MALWQYTFFILPGNAIREKGLDFVFPNNHEEFDDTEFWSQRHEKPSLFDQLTGILPKASSWSKSINLYGSQESNCLEVMFENDIIASVSFRIDFRTNYEDILRAIIEFIINNDLIILDENLSKCPLNFEVVNTIIASSPQVKKYKRLSS